MSLELKMLVWSIVLGLIHVAIAATLSTQQRGTSWNIGNREGEPALLTGMAGRADRALRNFLETFAFFAAAVLAVMITAKYSGQTARGVQLYFWARVVYLPVYLIGIPYLRTLVWVVSVVGIVLVLVGLT
jgi:uncharacterized MAPEG superfamily protein